MASKNALPPNELIASHPHAFGLESVPGVVCAVVGGLGGEVTVYIADTLRVQCGYHAGKGEFPFWDPNALAASAERTERETRQTG